MKGLLRLHCLAIPAIAGIILATGFASQKDPNPLVGTWDIQLSQGSSFTSVEFGVNNGKLTGRFRGVDGVFSLAHVDFDGKRLAFTWTFERPEASVVMSYNATVSRDRMMGTCWIDEVSSQAFKAMKRKTKLDPGSSRFDFLWLNSAVPMSTQGYGCY